MNQSLELRSSCCVDGRRSSTFLGQLHQFEPNLAHARVDETEFPGDAIGYINFASFLIGTSVINTYQFKFPGSGVHDAHQGAEWEMRGSGGESLPIEELARGRPAGV